MQDPVRRPVARRVWELLEPFHLVSYMSEEPTAELMALGLRGYWDGYFASRAAPLGLVPAEVVHAVFHNFAPGEAARHLPWVWSVTTPEAALAARERGAVAALRRLLGDAADSAQVARAADLALVAGLAAPVEGRALYAGLRALPLPTDPVARLWHAATLLREHRGGGHIAALMAEGIGGGESHALLALTDGMRAQDFGRLGHLPADHIAGIVDGMRARGLVGDDGWLTDEGRATKARVEAVTDALAEPAYDALSDVELTALVGLLEPLLARLVAAGSR
ncbi:SCO6745 family protein [Lapillicoccus jejuensis]|uniref:Uncharacterized protein n=1 Tax=Lapillicoccus jejuensis TaxID=402171 RepID=A0A542DZZ7_9MICO|nr:hypothetical protein [Lapillicoccus jejuensis]TQJ08626.1 hypothetical protein FB458_1717 [Lapillicoccus jejuensis]